MILPRFCREPATDVALSRLMQLFCLAMTQKRVIEEAQAWKCLIRQDPAQAETPSWLFAHWTRFYIYRGTSKWFCLRRLASEGWYPELLIRIQYYVIAALDVCITTSL